MWGDAVRTVYEDPVNVECCGEECACVSGGLVWDIIGHSVRSLQELVAGDGASVCVRETQYARGRPAHVQQRSVRWWAGRVCGCGVLARGQKTIYADAGRVHGCGVRARRTESYRHRYNLEARGKRVSKSVNRRIIIS